MKVFYKKSIADRICDELTKARSNAQEIECVHLTEKETDELVRWIDRYLVPGFFIGNSTIAWFNKPREFKFKDILIKEIKEVA